MVPQVWAAVAAPCYAPLHGRREGGGQGEWTCWPRPSLHHLHLGWPSEQAWAAWARPWRGW
eukprot:scaffold32446_cov13-Tisochrysis_lutea.AAC.1